jgi:hypothetical protein
MELQAVAEAAAAQVDCRRHAAHRAGAWDSLAYKNWAELALFHSTAYTKSNEFVSHTSAHTKSERNWKC